LTPDSSPKVYTVTEITEGIKTVLEDAFGFVWVEGEISNFRAPHSGHYYMTLKDPKTQIRAVMFRFQNRYMRFVPEDGMKVIVQGRIGLYAPRGEYQIVLDYMEPMGIGALALAFDQIKTRLSQAGIFDEALKRPLPFLPQKVAVITSPTGAAIRDFLKIIQRRFANIEILVIPVRVQGAEASDDIVHALNLIDRHLPVDVIVVTRGGGSMEDLWAFNEEKVAMAIRRSRIPVVSAIGHEIDVTISDLAADVRASTPSAAAEMLVAEKESLVVRLKEMKGRLETGFRHRMRAASADLERLINRLRDPRKELSDLFLRLDELQERLTRKMEGLMEAAHHRVASEIRSLISHSPMALIFSGAQRIEFQRHLLVGLMIRQLREKRLLLAQLAKRARSLNPSSVLKRGYSITRLFADMRILRSVRSVRKGDRILILLAQGEMECLVDKVKDQGGN
jgi:exodeoxyribonuclease VII large subunit